MKKLALFLAFLLTACAARQAPPPQCERMYILLPDNYIIDLAAGARVQVDPALQDIAVFCTPEEARQMLRETAPRGQWAIYELEGEFAEMTEPAGNGDFKLVKAGNVRDWIAE